MTKIKVNVWQMGYINLDYYATQNKHNLECVPRGYVCVVPSEYWEEEVWHLLNWGSWNNDEDGTPIKPENVHSEICYCGSNIILKAENSDIYRYAKSIGWGTANTLEEAKECIIREHI